MLGMLDLKNRGLNGFYSEVGFWEFKLFKKTEKPYSDSSYT